MGSSGNPGKFSDACAIIYGWPCAPKCLCCGNRKLDYGIVTSNVKEVNCTKMILVNASQNLVDRIYDLNRVNGIYVICIWIIKECHNFFRPICMHLHQPMGKSRAADC